MIYDNYHNISLLGIMDLAAVDARKFLLGLYQGSIIITTRSLQVKIGHPIWVEKLENVRESLEILSNMSRLEGPIQNKDLLDLWMMDRTKYSARPWCCRACQGARQATSRTGYSWSIPWPSGHKFIWLSSPEPTQPDLQWWDGHRSAPRLGVGSDRAVAVL